MQLEIWTTEKRNVRHGNVLDVDLKITKLKIFRSHQKKIRNEKIKYVLMKKVIVHATTSIIIVAKRYFRLWHTCLLITNVLVETLVTVHN